MRWQKAYLLYSPRSIVATRRVSWGEGHTANFTFKPSSSLDNVVLTSHLTVFPPVPIGPSYGDKVNFLWMVPISDMERLAFHTAGDGTLIDRLQEIGDAALSLDREVLG